MAPKLEILTNDERRLIETTDEGGFVDQFVAWAGKRTDAPAYTLRSAALMALSMAAGDTVVLPGIFSNSPVHMNLYILIVGPSTVMRKTTVLNYVMDLLPRNQQTQQKYVTVIDDTSPQAFNKAAAEAGKTMSPVILNMDEVAGVFQVTRRRNSYGAGFDKVLLRVYDHTPVVINRTSGDTEAPRGAFVNLFAASTPEPLAEVLNADDVESGLLPRFLIFDARDAARGKRRTLMERMASADEWAEEQSEMADFLYQIARERANGIPVGTDADGLINYKVRTLPIAPEAIERLDKIDLLFTGDIGKDTSAFAAIKGRALWQAYKLAGLYALSRDGINAEVQLIDVLRAAHLIETVAGDLAQLHEDVGANDLERQIQATLDFLSQSRSGAQRQSAVINHLSLSASDAGELIRTLAMRDLVKVEKDGSAQVWRKV